MFSIFVIINHDTVSFLFYAFVELLSEDKFPRGIAESEYMYREFGSMLPNCPPKMTFNLYLH